MSKILLTLALLPLSQVAMALEVEDLRLELGGYSPLNTHDHQNTVAGSDSAIYTGNSSTSDTSDDYTNDESYAFKFVTSLGQRLHSYGGVLLSVGFAGWRSSNDYFDPGAGLDTTLYREIDEFQVGVGYGLPVNRWSYVEAMVDFGIGSMSTDGYDRSKTYGYSEISTASSTEESIGAHIGWFAHFWRYWMAGLEVGVSSHFADSLHNNFSTGTHVDESFRQTLIDYRFAFGFHF